MAKIIKNKRTDSSVTYAGQRIEAESSYIIPTDELAAFQTSDLLKAHLLDEAQDTVMLDSNSPDQDLVGSAAVDYLTDNVQVKVIVSEEPPFHSKVLSCGGKIYRRVHGVSAVIPANDSGPISFVVPYNYAKITGVEIVNGKVGDKVDFKVYDTPQGAISTVPNYMLNQFGFGVYVADGHYAYNSKYDANLIKDLKLEATYYNDGNEELTVYMNLILHEVVPCS